MQKPKVSVIITTYNRPNYLEEAVKSVVNQTFQDFEILIIDDGSKEKYAKDVVNKYEKCLYFFKNNGGVSSARNYGINKSKGDYIAFLDDDDYWKNNKLEIQVNLLNNKPEIDCIHSSIEVVNEKGKLLNKRLGASKNKAHKRSGYVFWNALGVWLVKASTPLIRKKVFNNNKMMFDETLEVGEDTDFYQRMFYKHKVIYIEEPLTFYREYNNISRLSLQNSKYIGLEKKIYNNFVKMGIKNPFVMYKIASKLLISGVNRYNFQFPKSKIKLNLLDKYIYPMRKLKNIKFN